MVSNKSGRVDRHLPHSRHRPGTKALSLVAKQGRGHQVAEITIFIRVINVVVAILIIVIDIVCLIENRSGAQDCGLHHYECS